MLVRLRTNGSFRSCLLRLLLGLLLCHGSVVGTLAQEQPAAPSGQPEVTVELIEARRQEVNDAQDLDEATKSKLLDVYRIALEGLQRAEELKASAAQDTEAAATVDARLQAIKSELAQLQAAGETSISRTGSLPDLEQELAEQNTELTNLRKTQAEWEAEPLRRANRRKEIRSQLTATPARLAEIEQQQAAPPPSDESSILTTARQIELSVRKLLAETELSALQAELSKYDSEESVDLVRTQRDLIAQQVALLETRVATLTDVVNQRRRAEAERAVEQARLEAAQSEPALREWAQRNQQLAEEAQLLAAQIASAQTALKTTKDLHHQIITDFDETKEKIDSVGLSGPIGLMLRKQRAMLPRSSDRRRNKTERREKIDEVHFKTFEYDDERSELANLDAVVEDIVNREGGSRSDDELTQLERSATEILQRQREYLDQLNRSYGTYFGLLVELDSEEAKLIEDTDKFIRFINEHVLWIRSTQPLSLSNWGGDDASLAWLTDPTSWLATGHLVWNDILNNTIAFGCALLVFGTLFQLQFRFRRELVEIGKKVKRPTFSEFAPTIRATLLTLMIAIFWPGLLMYLSWRLGVAADGDEFTAAVARGVLSVALLLIPLEMVRQICRPHGLAEAHFGWSTKAVRLLSRNLRWLFLIVLPLSFVTATLNARRLELGHDVFERVCYVASMVALAFFIHKVLQPGKGLLREVIAYNQGGWLDRLKFFWFWACVGIPLVLAVLAGMGYHYTALRIHDHALSTVWMLVGLVLVRSFLLRWLHVQRRKLSIEQAKERRAAAQTQAEAEADASSVPVLATAEQADLATISSQIQRLLNAGLLTALLIGMWITWADVLPALSILDRWELASTTAQVTENVAPEGQPPILETKLEVVPITASHAVLAVLIALLTLIAARNVPGLLEISLLRRLPMDGALRYAVITLSSYLIVLVGVMLSFGAIGVGWSKVQWLATALTFGLGFGLQEIFANFVSGLIILFEQPIRVGDVVTIENTTGVVSKIRIRATTIVDWDRKEFIVPNREFLTGRLLNWTLSDSINRVVVNIGVAYGTDTRQAKQIIEQVAVQHPNILDDPAPMITFEAFGDSTLNFVLRAYLPNMENRLNVIHDLHTQIDDAFREAGIEIAFPQRDLHIRSLPEPLAAFQTTTSATGSNGGLSPTVPSALATSDASAMEASE